MLLAAGRGERLRPLTDSRPKPLVDVAGYPLIDYHLRALAAADVRRVVINLSWLGEQIVDAVGDGGDYGLDVRYSDEGAHALETGGGVTRALPLLGDEPFLVINADVWTDYPLDRLTKLASGTAASVVLVDNPAHNPDGDFDLREARLTNDRRYTFSGIGLYRPAFFEGYGERYSLATPLRDGAARGDVAAEHFPGQWWDVGTAQRLSALRSFLAGDR